ncbi:ubiquitin-specific protease ubp15 [Yamadazyma tenuis]|uniref:ubiquitinyl hydrolase 1 n=1 Tax=Candida tenuis (strain ATCC 10573 / BCRC 21748 / CBS 615 / JCM 9827 / NBRC 10315 / NRRL Y-1498 / VKM Y-70) TaxID=590646 RepID=G3AXT1_CANTC|nr:uncharacterized protein CANTEDRAFT_101235 [Yamadazyma tenuis ATCC 10573]EGV65690.1 hypothetical protein CANTEDRAFT_101235 [Yamadazyma tenuis ATCC 10573]WEJ95997.1 ubiquitin-specific protease ubp15 [Yamadazyma tenuis]
MISDVDSLENKENQYQLTHPHKPVDSQSPGIAIGANVESSWVDLQSSDTNVAGLHHDISGVEVDDVDVDDEEDDLDDDDDESVTSPHRYTNKTTSQSPSRPSLPASNDFHALSHALLKPVPDYPVSDEGFHVWEIKNWSGLTDHKVRGPRFKVGNYEWNVLLFPRGNNNTNYMSVYIEPHPLGPESDDWYACAQFAFDLWNPQNPKCHFSGSSHHRFNKNETDWGFSSIIDLGSLYRPRNNEDAAIIANNQLNITAYVKIIDDSQTGVLWYNFQDYDSKKNTGYVGLNNQGATCYLNSLLQSYYTTKIFRKLVYRIPTTSNTIIKSNKKIRKQSSVALSLQKIFYLLSTSPVPVGTLELTKAFGWDTSDAFTQHDIQELNRILMDKLETSMKGTPIEGKLNDLFVGEMKSFIKCINVPYESSRVEDFWDIQLNVKGYNNLTDSFKNYIELEMLTDDNKYQAGDDYGYQDAKKGVVFRSFPAVLHLQLKRFEYDFMIDDLQKINDLYEYPNEIDLSPYLDEDLPGDVKSQNWTYKLHGVLVHQGSISNGHYYAMIKPKAHEDYWLRFEDDKVWKVTRSQVFEENFGANELSQEEFFKLSKFEQNENMIRRSTSAYMLVYYRETMLDEILPDDDEEIDKCVPSFIPVEIEQQINEVKMIEDLKLQQLYNININIVNLTNFQNYSEFDYYYDSTNQKYYDKQALQKNQLLQPLVLSLKKTDTIFDLYNKISETLNVPVKVSKVDHLSDLPYRLLLICHRNNQTNRVDGCLNLSELLEENGEKDLTLTSIYNKLFNKRFDEMVFYTEEFKYDLDYVNEHNAHKSVPIEDFKFESVSNKFKNASQLATTTPPLPKTLDDSSNNIVIFFKFFNHFTNELRGLTHLVVPKDEKVANISNKLKKLLDLDTSVNLELVEELTPNKLEVVHVSSSLEKNELSNGDILICQVHSPEGNKALAEYFKFLTSRLHLKVSLVKNDLPRVASEDMIKESDDELSDVAMEKNSGVDSSDGDEEVFYLWVSSTYSYEQLSKKIGERIKQNPEYLRFFVINQQGFKLPISTSSNLAQFFPKSLPISTLIDFEYEVLQIPLKELESMKVLNVTWVTNIMQYEELEILVPIHETAHELVEKVFEALEERSHDTSKIDKSNLFMYCGNNSKYVDLVKFNKPIDSLNESLDYYIGEFPTELNVLINYDLVSRYQSSSSVPNFESGIEKYEYDMAVKHTKDLNIIPVFHFHKNSNYHHSIPFLLVLFPNESFKNTKKRLQHKLGFNDLNFGKVKFALADSNDKGKYLDEHDNLILYNEVTSELSSLALDHFDKNPKKSMFDKGIQIK